MTVITPKPGDWVSIRAKVLSQPRPEEFEVELFSNTDQYPALIRVDLCEQTTAPLPEEPAGRSVALIGGMAYQRGNYGWFAAGVDAGEAYWSWAELHEKGDVEVIHHA